MSDIKQLGYLRVQSTDLARWRELAVDALGFAVGSGPDEDALYLRMDERNARLIIVPGDSDKAQAVGWEVADGIALDNVKATLEAAGVAVTELSEEEATQRSAERVIAFTDPGGTPVEIFFGPILDHSNVVTPHGNQFVTQGVGMGHVVLPIPNSEETVEFYQKVLGFRARGAIRLGGPYSVPARRVRFLGINARHHSLAICPAPPNEAPGLVHLMVEVTTLDAVGQALDRVKTAGFPISSTLGRHTNDKMVSFYVRAPGGWDVEYGCEGMLVDDATYTAEEITKDEYWGHDWSWGHANSLAAFKM